MSENLSQMVKNGPTEESIIFSEKDLDIPVDTKSGEIEPEIDSSIIEIISLADWIEDNISNFPNIRKPTISITGVNPIEQLLLTVSNGVDNDGSEKRKIVIFDDAQIRPVLNRPAMDMQIYNNGFRIIYDLGDKIFVKCYGVRTGAVCVFCNDINDIIIPYGILKSNKKSESISILKNDVSIVNEKLSLPIDMEALQLRYKQSSKAVDLKTNLDAIIWLLDRQAIIEDINHHLQIDSVIIDSLA